MNFKNSSILIEKDLKAAQGFVRKPSPSREQKREVVECRLGTSLHICLCAHQWVLL